MKTTPPSPSVPAAATAKAASGTVPIEKITSVEGITEYRLPNGLRVLLFPDESKPTVLVNITYLVGSRHEGYGESGMAHLLEHMLFKGTATRPNVWKDLEQHGANFNGTTWLDRTNYYEELPATPENLEFALALEADRMLGSRIAAEDLAKEFSVVRNEFERLENMAEAVLEDKMMSVAYQWHNYGKTTIGSRSDIERVPIEKLRAFYRRYYRPDNAVLIVAGKLDPEKTLSWISQHFGPLPKPTEPVPTTWTVEPVQDGERTVTLRRSGDVPLVSVLYHGVAGADPDKVAQEAIVDILTNKPSGRLYKALVKKGLASEVSGTSYALAEPGVMVFTARLPKGGNVDKVREILTREIESLGKTPITSEELDRYRSGFARDFQLIMNETARAGVVLSEFAAMGDWRLLYLMRDQVKSITAADVTRVASAYLVLSNRTVGLFLPTDKPERAPLPPRPDVPALVKGYQGSATVSAGEAFLATVENIEARTRREILEGGIKISLLPKKTKGGQVRLALALRYGTENDLLGKTSAATLLPMMLARGTRKLSYQAIKDRLDALKSEVSFGNPNPPPGTSNVAQFFVKTTRENLLPLLELLAEVLREPAFPPGELETLRKEALVRLEEQQKDPASLASISLMRRLLPYPAKDVRYIPTVAEAIDQVRKTTIADVSGLYRRLWGLQAAQISVVGDFDPNEIKTALTSKLGAWKSRKPYQRIALPFRQNEVVDETIDTPDKEMAFVAVGQSLEMRDDDPAYPALFMVNYLLGGSPSSRLFNRLRQQEGISYGTASRFFAHPIDKNGFFFAWALAAPSNMDKAIRLIEAEIAGLIAAGVTEKELAAAKQSYAKAFEGRIANDEFVLGELNQGLFLDRTFVYFQKLNDAIQKLTPADVHAAAKTFLQAARFTKVRAGDLAKREAPGKTAK